jgi:hypothetical protein
MQGNFVTNAIYIGELLRLAPQRPSLQNFPGLPIIVAVRTRTIVAHLPRRTAFDLLRLVSASVSQIILQATCLELDNLHIVMPSPLFLPDSGQLILYIPNT